MGRLIALLASRYGWMCIRVCACGCDYEPHDHRRRSGATPCVYCPECLRWRPRRQWFRVPDSPAALAIPTRRES